MILSPKEHSGCVFLYNYQECTRFSLNIRVPLRSTRIYTSNFRTFVLFARPRCFELVEKRVLSECEANFV